MKTILILGAGLSASSLIRYLLENAGTYNWTIRVTDQNLELVKAKIRGHERGVALNFNALDPNERRAEIEKADLVISMLPARFHPEVAKDCLEFKKNLITPSYVSPEIKAMHDEAAKAGVIFMNEIGVDPGLDHMSAMKIIDEIKRKGGEINSFKSYCGGLIAPESDDNPWNYKFTWNPRNVVLAGQGGAACFIRQGRYKYIPYHRLFDRLNTFQIEGFGEFRGYPNRDSLSYRSVYGLENIPTIIRGTLRRPGYCEGWNVFIELGMTDDSYAMVNTEGMTPRVFLNSFLPYHASKSVEVKFKEFLREDRMYLYSKFEWLGLFEDKPILMSDHPSPAKLLEEILVSKLSLNEGDKDMLVMIHEFEYSLKGNNYKITSSMVNIGEDQVYTSMSNTVGLPAAICAKMILTDQIKSKGVLMPIAPEIYNPILDELKTFSIDFHETERLLH